MAILAMLVGWIMMLGVVFGVAGTAHAATLTPSDSSQRLEFPYNNMTYYLGLAGTDGGGTRYYCIEAGKLSDHLIGPTQVVRDNEDARRMAWILDRYRNADAATYAAIAIIVQDHFGRDGQDWAQQMAVIRGLHPSIVARAGQIWQESAGKVAADVVIERTDAEALRSGAVEVKVVDYAGNPIAEVPFTVTLQGPAYFTANAGSTFSGVSTDASQSIAWQASGRGEVTASTTYKRGRLHVMDSTQDMLAFDAISSVGGASTNFTVRKDFAPVVSTAVSDKLVDAGSPVFDEVTSGLADKESPWMDGITLKARGYYFDGLPARDLGQVIAPKPKESADDFLARLKARGYRPSAYGDADFSATGQSRRVQAMTKPGGTQPYLTGAAGGFGTWVWAFEMASQSEQAKEYLVGDWVSPFLEASESNSNRGRLTVASTVTEHSAEVGSDLSDTITVVGFPEDHGSFEGDEDYGFGADLAYAQVSVWWSGDEGDPSNDEAYKPSGDMAPTEDEHHRLVGAWDIPAVNGTFKIGAGAQDANGEPILITAESHGWYVFMWEFKGDDRVMPAASRYDDAWERTRVIEPDKPVEPDEPVEPEKPLPLTGSGVAVAFGVGVAAFVVGALMLAVVRRRSL
jgi:hypothetical protein